jgi:sterol desaturase/sphingolipid hydroxylase (fatty acid hydroxylase superfamily)
LSVLIAYAVPVFLLTLVVEWWIVRARFPETRGYEVRDTWASLAMGLGNVAINGVTKGAALLLFVWAYEHRVLDLGAASWAWWVLIPAEDLCYYVFHRVHHEVRFFWAAHVNHHSSRHFNLSTALRQPWTTPLTGPVFWAPLAFVGFEPAQILTAQAISLIYQYWIHTETIGRLGPLEAVLNTPSHHRVHHGANPEYLDRNYAGISIVWDRLFGTFEREREAVDYGLTRNIHTFNPVRIAFHEWVAMGRDAVRASSWREALAYVFRPPGWSPDGSSLTAGQLRARRLRAS